MTVTHGHDGRPSARKRASLAADGAAHMLDHLSDDGSTAAAHPVAPAPDQPPSLPTAFSHGGVPYSLDDLLCGLPAIDDGELLLSEVEQTEAATAGGWTEEIEHPHSTEIEAPSADEDQNFAPDAMMEFGDAFMSPLGMGEVAATAASASPSPEESHLAATMGDLATALDELNDDGDAEITQEDEATTGALTNLVTALQSLAAAEDNTAAPPDKGDRGDEGDESPASTEAVAEPTDEMLASLLTALQDSLTTDTAIAVAESAAEGEASEDIAALTEMVSALRAGLTTDEGIATAEVPAEPSPPTEDDDDDAPVLDAPQVVEAATDIAVFEPADLAEPAGEDEDTATAEDFSEPPPTTEDDDVLVLDAPQVVEAAADVAVFEPADIAEPTGEDEGIATAEDFRELAPTTADDDDVLVLDAPQVVEAAADIAEFEPADMAEPAGEDESAATAEDFGEPAPATDDDVLVLDAPQVVEAAADVAVFEPADIAEPAGEDESVATAEVSAEPPPATEDDDVLLLEVEAEDKAAADQAPAPNDMRAPIGDGEWDASAFALGNIIGALRGLAEEAPPATETAAPPETTAVPAEGAVTAPPPAVAAEEAAESPPEDNCDDTPDEAQALANTVEAIIAAHCPPGESVVMRGDPVLPQRLDALAVLLADPPPANDFAALDALYACWPKNTHDSASRALLAVAQNLSRNFGLPGKLPMASSKAWRMLSPTLFETDLAQRLADVGSFIADWQKSQRTFLILEFGEIELIEYLFEALHPGYHADLLAGVMNFKVLSNRRMGLLRRIPNRLKKQVTPLLPDNKEAALITLAHAKALLERIAEPSGFAPIVDTASKMRDEVEKMMKVVANIGAPPQVPPPASGGMPLGRIG